MVNAAPAMIQGIDYAKYTTSPRQMLNQDRKAWSENHESRRCVRQGVEN